MTCAAKPPVVVSIATIRDWCDRLEVMAMTVQEV